jgi:transposase
MQISTIGIDLAKSVFQVHGVDAAEKPVLRKQLRRGQVLEFFSKLPPCTATSRRGRRQWRRSPRAGGASSVIEDSREHRIV